MLQKTLQSLARDCFLGLATLRDLHWGGARLGGIFHAAGVLSDALLADQEAWRFRAVFAPKVHGASCLQRGVACVGLRHFLVYSSVAALLGAPGQAPHSAANTWLDSFTHWRRSLGLAAQGLQWGSVAEIGYAARHGAESC